MGHGLLLLAELLLTAVKVTHQLVKLFVFLGIHHFLTCIQKQELALELLLGIGFILLFLVNLEEVGQLWFLLPVANFYNDPHNHVFESVFPSFLLVVHIADSLWHLHDIVKGVLLLLAQDFLMEAEHLLVEAVLAVPFFNFLQFVKAQLQHFAVLLAPHIHIHLVLHEEGLVVNDRATVEPL